MKKFYPELIITVFLLCFHTTYSQWFLQYTFNPAQSMYAVKFYNNSTGWVGSALYGGSTMNIYKTTNGGFNWTAQNSYRQGTRVNDFFVFSPDTAFCVGNFGMLLRTVNGGITWDSANLGIYPSIYGIDFINNNTGFVVGDAGNMWKTTNKGLNWIPFYSGISSGLNRILFVNSTTGFIIAQANFVYKTTDAGDNWFNINFPYIGPFDFLREIIATDPNTLYISADIGRVRKTTDGGINWTMLNTPTTEALFALDYADANIIYACGGAGVVIKTTNAGINWTLQQTPLNENLYGMDVVSADTVYISSWSGKILKTTNGGVVGFTQVGSEVPIGFKLFQNYPNPFNPATRIQFVLPYKIHAELVVYDYLGRKVIVLLNEQLNAGSYEIEFDGSNFSSGIYFCRLLTNDFTETKTMVLIK